MSRRLKTLKIAAVPHGFRSSFRDWAAEETDYLHGLAEGDFELAMRGLLGEGAPLSKSSIQRLRAGWTAEFEEWSQRRLEGREVVYVWADGIYVKAGLERDKAALLVVLGAMRDGTKEVLALRSGYRESVESCSEVLRDLKARGIEAPRLLMADGNAAIWGAVRQVWPEAGEQRCWNHKMRNVLDRLPQREQSEAKDLLRAVVRSGTITLRRPRVRGVEERFESRVLPLFARRTKELGALLPELYLHGLAEGDFELAMRGLLGEGAPLSKSSIRRLRAGWTAEFEEWSQRRLEGREVVYVWADGIYVKAGLERDKAALLVVLGAMRDGTKEVLALRSGYRESVESCSEVLRDLKARGIEAPRLLMADGNAAIWGAVRQVWPEAGEQRCWNHKMRNVLDRLPQREQSEAKDLLRAVVRQALQAVVSEGGGRTRGRLGADGGVLRLPRGPLEASTHDEW